jgi:predicted lipoprotein
MLRMWQATAELAQLRAEFDALDRVYAGKDCKRLAPTDPGRR